VSTRERLLDAAERIIRQQGIMAVTTKDIARAAGFSEGTLYRHFADKTDLLLAVMSERISGSFLRLIRELPARAGTHTVQATLEELASAALAFFTQTAPLSAAIAADPAFAARHYVRLRELGAGPEVTLKTVVAYIEAEQQLGRVRADASAAAAATLLLGVCFNYAEVRHTAGTAASVLPEERFAREIVRTLLHGLTPDTARSH